MINKEIIYAIKCEVEHLFHRDTPDGGVEKAVEAILLQFGKMKALKLAAQEMARIKIEEATAKAKEDIENIYGE